jgi:hypothetical protein
MNNLQYLTSDATVPGVGGSNFPYGNSFAWDPIHNRIVFIGTDHGLPIPTNCPYFVYTESDNTWNWFLSGLINSSNGVSHPHDGNTVRPDTGDHYFRANGGGTGPENLYRQTFGGVWAPVTPSPLISQQIFVANEWWPGSNTGSVALAGKGAAGCLVIFEINLGNVALYDPLANSWELITVPSTQPTQDVYHTLAAYSKQFNCIIYGGGNSATGTLTQNWIWRLDQNKTATRLVPDSPIRFGIQCANLVCDPVSGEFVFWGGPGGQRSLYKLNPTGSGTFTDLTLARPVPGAVSTPSSGPLGPDSVCSVAIPAHGAMLNGVIAYFSQNTRSNANCYLYRHA